MSEHTLQTNDTGSDTLGTGPDSSRVNDAVEDDDLSASETTGHPDEPPVEPSAVIQLPLDELFDLLQNQRRRYVLRYLDTAEGQVTLSELAEQIAAWENDKPVKSITSSERKRVYVGLYQGHLPKMDGMGVISFNKPRGLVERGRNATDVEPFLRQTDETAQPNSPDSAVGLVILALAVLPAAVLLYSQALLPRLLALATVVIATLGGLAYLSKDPIERVTSLIEVGRG